MSAVPSSSFDQPASSHTAIVTADTASPTRNMASISFVVVSISWRIGSVLAARQAEHAGRDPRPVVANPALNALSWLWPISIAMPK